MGIRTQLEKLLRATTRTKGSLDLTVPDRKEFGHYSTNIAMRLAKEEKKNPLLVAGEIVEKLLKQKNSVIEKAEVAPPGFINLWLKKEAIQNELQNIIKAKGKLERNNVGKGKKVIVEYSSTNVAKEMHVGHLRNTLLGDALANLYEASGYKVIRWNYLGDWGTSFGKIIAAYKRWGDKREVEKTPIKSLLALYVRFNKEAKENPELDEEGRKEFKKLEEGNKENRKLWEWFRKESIKEFDMTYKRLGIHFDTLIGESFFEKEMEPIVTELLKKQIAVRSEGAIIVPLDTEGLPPAMAQKADGASLYFTRDIALLRYRLNKYKPAKILHVVGNEQSLHLAQVFATARKMKLVGSGTKFAEPVHVKYGLVLGETGRKFSTREGEAVFAAEVVGKSVALARRTVEEKRSEFSSKEKDMVAEAVGIGALKYTNLKENRNSDITFNWEAMLDFSGDSGPYLQYTYARLRNIIRKSGVKGRVSSRTAKKNLSNLLEENELALVRKMVEFPRAIQAACEAYAPNTITLYCYELANLANSFYETTPILADDNLSRKNARLLLVEAVADTLKNALRLTGISAPEKI